MQIVEIAFTGYSVTNMKRAKEFYEGVLGIPHESGDEYGDFHRFPNGTLLRLTPMPGFTASPHPVVGWDVADIRTAAAARQAR